MVSEMKGKVIYTNLLKEDLVIIRILPDEGMPDYITGQFLTIGVIVPTETFKLVRRAYSIASNPENKDYFEFVIRWVRNPLPGRVTTMLFHASVGDEVKLGYPTGNALLINETLSNGEKDNRRIVCVGGGTGLAPFIAYANHLHDVGDNRQVVVLHGASYVDELSYKKMLTDLEDDSIRRGEDQWNFKYRAAISRPKEYFNRSWSGHVGRVESFFKEKKDGLSPLDELVGEKCTPENTFVYICGYQGTIDGVIDLTKSRGFVTKDKKLEDGSFAIKFESYG